MKTKTKGDVAWHIPGRKTPVAFSTTATSYLIAVLALEHESDTIRDLQTRINYDQEAKAVLQAYIDRGFGGQVASEWFKP